MKTADIEVEVKGVSDSGLADKVAQINEKNCFIHNSVETCPNTKFDYKKS